MSIEDLKNEQKNSSQKKVEIKKTLSDEFIEELEDDEKEIFLKLKSILLNTCGLLEFEAITEDTLNDFTLIITYVKEGVISIEDDGILFKVRKPIVNSNGDTLTNKVKILFERNEGREKVFTKKIKIAKNDMESQKDYTRACLAASLENVDVNGKSVIISMANTRSLHNRDYMLLLTCFNFFRS